MSWLTGFAYTTLLERRVIARFQSRIRPNRAGPQGLLQPLADGVKLIFQGRTHAGGRGQVHLYPRANRGVDSGLVVFAVIPIGGKVNLFGVERISFLAPDLNVGVLYILAITSIACTAS